MNAKVYPKHVQRAEGENRVAINALEENALRKALDEQLRQHGIRGLQHTLVQVIFQQTVGYRKRCEDISGKRLENLIGSRYDYCNRNLKVLISQSIIIAEDGYYGRLLAVNFDFSQWGKVPEDGHPLHSDPESLIPQLDLEPLHTPPESEDTADDSAESEHNINITPSHKIPSEYDAKSLKESLLMGIMVYAIEALNTLFPSPASDISLSPSRSDSTPLSETVNTITNTPETQPNPPEIHSQPSEIINAPETKPNPPEIQASKTISPAEKPHNTPETVSKAPENNEKPDFSFPAELKPHEKKAIEKLIVSEQLENNPSAVQLLLDDLKSRFQISDWQPIRSPIAYFRSLIRSFKQNNFVSDYVEAYREQRKTEAEQAEKETQAAKQYDDKAQYQEAHQQYRQAAFLASFDGCSLREMAKRQRWERFIEAMGFDLDLEPKQVLAGAT